MKRGWLVWCIACAGILIRARLYFSNRSLWLDEALLGNEIAERTWGSILLRPNEGTQTAPLLFFLAEKIVGTILGFTDWALRLMPFFAGILTCIVAVFLARRYLQSLPGRLLFTALIAFSPALVYYSVEVKQYGLDALVCMVLLLGMSYIENGSRASKIAALAGGMLIWLSQPSIFVLFGGGATLAIAALFRKQQRTAVQWLAISLFWLALVGLEMWRMNEYRNHHKWLYDFWAAGFAPFPPVTLSDWLWYPRCVLGWLQMCLFKPSLGPLSASSPDGSLSLLNGLLSVFAGAGVCFWWRRRPEWAGYVCLPIAGAIAASLLKIFPACGRPVLFIVPIILLMLSAGCDFTFHKSGRIARLLSWILAVGITISPVVTTLAALVKPPVVSDMKGALAFVADRRRPGDAMVVSDFTANAYNFYRDHQGIEAIPISHRISMRPESNEILAWLKASREVQCFWVVLSHNPVAAEPMLRELDQMFSKQHQWHNSGITVVCYQVYNTKAE